MRWSVRWMSAAVVSVVVIGAAGCGEKKQSAPVSSNDPTSGNLETMSSQAGGAGEPKAGQGGAGAGSDPAMLGGTGGADDSSGSGDPAASGGAVP